MYLIEDRFYPLGDMYSTVSHHGRVLPHDWIDRQNRSVFRRVRPSKERRSQGNCHKA